MKITELYIYPIKALAPLSVARTRLRPEGLEHDRRFMLLRVEADGTYRNLQITECHESVLFHQKLSFKKGEGEIVVTYHIPTPPIITPIPAEQRTALRIPLSPAPECLEVLRDAVLVAGSPTTAYRVLCPVGDDADAYDRWFSACFGFAVVLVYIGDQGRDVLAHRPSEHRLWRKEQQQQQQQPRGWLGGISSFIPGMGNGDGKGKVNNRDADDDVKLVFNECAPFLITSLASLREVSARLPEGEEMDMRRFRPNIVVGDDDDDDEEKAKEGELLKAWEEDYWAEVSITSPVGGLEKNNKQKKEHRLALTANCGRCISINIDYDKGRKSEGEAGKVLRKLMADRRVDGGNKYCPVFGRYAFLAPGREEEEGDDDGGDVEIAVGDEVRVTKRIDYRDEWAWPRP